MNWNQPTHQPSADRMRIRRQIDCSGEPLWLRQQPGVVERQRVTIVMPPAERRDGSST